MALELELKLAMALMSVLTPVFSAGAAWAVMRFRQAVLEARVEEMERWRGLTEDRLAAMQGDVREVRNDVKWIRGLMERGR